MSGKTYKHDFEGQQPVQRSMVTEEAKDFDFELAIYTQGHKYGNALQFHCFSPQIVIL